MLLLFHVSARDPGFLALVATLMLAVAALASGLPARLVPSEFC